MALLVEEEVAAVSKVNKIERKKEEAEMSRRVQAWAQAPVDEASRRQGQGQGRGRGGTWV